MEIKLVKHEEANFNLDETKCETLSYQTLSMLTDFKVAKVDDDDKQKYVVFKTKDELFENINKYEVDTTKDILINSKGNFFCALKSPVAISKNQEDSNEPADSKEN